MADVVLTETATAALRLAASRRRADGSLTTCLVLDTVARVDGTSPWWRIWLETGEPDALGLADAPDRVNRGVAGRWEGVPLSGDMASAMATLQMLSERYNLVPVSPGVLALALVANPFSGAARELCANGLPHADLLELIQDSLLGTTLDGLHAALAATSVRDEPGGAAEPGRTAREDATHARSGKVGAKAAQQGGPSPAAVLSAAEALRLATEHAGSRSADELDLLAAMLTADQSRECLEQRLGVDEDLLQETGQPLRAIGLRSVLEVSPAENGDSALHLLAGLAREPSPALSWLLRLAGIDKDDVEAEAWDAISTAEGRQRSPSARVITLNVVSFLSTLTETVLLIIHVAGPGSLWSLALIPFAWLGVPRWPASVPILIAIPVFVFVTPATGALQLLTGLADLLHSRAERHDTIARTGVIVSPAVARRVALRRTTGGRLDLLLRREFRLRLLRPRLLRAAAAATARREIVSAR